MWFKHRQRVDAAFAKGLMFGKAVGKRDERDRLVAIFKNDYWHHLSRESYTPPNKPVQIHSHDCLGCQIILSIKGGKDD